MEKLAQLKQRASEYTLDSLKTAVQGQKPIGKGMEGTIYGLDNDLVVKFRRGRGAGYNQYQDNLAEHSRQAVHDAINALSNGAHSWEITNRFTGIKQTLTARLIDILVPFVNGKESVSIMPRLHGQTLNYNSTIIGMFDAYKKLGVTVDDHGENIMRMYWGDYAEVDDFLLETWGVIHPDIFKAIETCNPANRKEILRHLAKAHLYGGTNSYPTPHEEMARMEGIGGFYSPISWHDVALVSKANNHLDITYENLHDCLNVAQMKLSKSEEDELSRCGLSDYEWKVMGIPGIAEARQLFGPQFIPVKFDWDMGSNLDVYGINIKLYHEFKKALDTVRPEVQPTISEAKRLMEQR